MMLVQVVGLKYGRVENVSEDAGVRVFQAPWVGCSGVVVKFGDGGEREQKLISEDAMR